MSAVGVREVIAPAEAPAPVAPAAEIDRAAEGYAVEFARAYLSFDATRPAARERALRQLVPDELAPEAGFEPRSGSRQVLWAQVVQSRKARSGGRVVVVAAQTDADPRPLYLAVRVARTRRGELRLAGYPALVGPPAVATGALPDREDVDDPELTAVARRVVTNYLADEVANLEADLVPSARISLPSIPLDVRAVDEVTWADGPDSGAVVATVEALDEQRASYVLSYELGIEHRRGRPYVSFIETVPTSP